MEPGRLPGGGNLVVVASLPKRPFSLVIPSLIFAMDLLLMEQPSRIVVKKAVLDGLQHQVMTVMYKWAIADFPRCAPFGVG